MKLPDLIIQQQVWTSQYSNSMALIQRTFNGHHTTTLTGPPGMKISQPKANMGRSNVNSAHKYFNHGLH